MVGKVVRGYFFMNTFFCLTQAIKNGFNCQWLNEVIDGVFLKGLNAHFYGGITCNNDNFSI